MPVFYFDIDDGETLLRDDEGLYLKDEQAARDEGARALAEMARTYIPSALPQKNIIMWVRNESSAPVCQVAMTFAVRAIPR